MLPLILDIGKIARRDKHFITYCLAAFFSPFSGLFDCCSKRLEVVFWYRSFCHINSPDYILQFTLVLRYVYTIHINDVNNSLYIKRRPNLFILLTELQPGLCKKAPVFFVGKLAQKYVKDINKMPFVLYKLALKIEIFTVSPGQTAPTLPGFHDTPGESRHPSGQKRCMP